MGQAVEDSEADSLGRPKALEHAMAQIFGVTELEELIHHEPAIQSKEEEQRHLCPNQGNDGDPKIAPLRCGTIANSLFFPAQDRPRNSLQMAFAITQLSITDAFPS